MHHLARGILVLVGAFVVTVSAILVVNSRSVQVEPTRLESAADLRIKEVEIEEETRGVRWRLKAEQALIFDAEGRTALRRLAVEVMDGDRSWTIVGDEGDVFQRDRRVEIRDNVVVTSSDGLQLETSVLRWDGRERRLWSDAPVRLSRAGSVIRGGAFELRLDDERTTVGGPVHAVFAQAR